MSETDSIVLMDNKAKEIAKVQDPSMFYVPEEIRKYLKDGEKITVKAVVQGNILNIIASMPLYNFGVQEIREFAEKHGFESRCDDAAWDIVSFEAQLGDVVLSYTQNKHAKASPATVLVQKTFSDIDGRKDAALSSSVSRLGEKFDVITNPEGDLDVINLLKEPGRFNMTRSEAIAWLSKECKKTGMTVAFRFNNKHHTVADVSAGLAELKALRI